MAVDQEGNFFYEDRALYEGIRQDLPLQARRWRVLKNVNHNKRGVLTFRNGIRPLNSAISGNPTFKAGIDAQFSSGTQKVVVVAGTDAYVLNTTTREFTAQSLTLANAQPDLQMFADKLLLFNGTDEKSYDGSSWANLSGSPPSGTIVTTHANRAIVSGVSGSPYEFYYSGVRNPNSWDTSNDKVIVGGTSGEAITAMTTLGSYLLVCTLRASWIYQQSATNPADWDFETISDDASQSAGCVANNILSVTRSGVYMAFAWDQRGPVVFYRIGNSVSVKPLWEPIYDIVQGNTDAPLEGLNTAAYSDVRIGYQEALQEVHFACAKTGDSENNVHLVYDLQSILEYINGNREQPIVWIKDNANTDWYPGDCLFPVRVGSDGLPSSTGFNRLFGGRQGVIYELDAPDVWTDAGNTIPHEMVRAGFSGVEDGVGDYRKVCNRIRIRGTHDGGYAINAQISADGDVSVDNDLIPLDSGVGLWNDGGVWTTDPNISTWNAQGNKSARGNLAVYGETFEAYLYDSGAINGFFELSEIALEGRIYERT